MAAKCKVPDCESPTKAIGLCGKHLHRHYRYGDVHVVKRISKGPVLCTIDGCSKPTNARGLCGMHYSRWYHHGDVGKVESTMAPAGTGHITPLGYRTFRLPDHPNAWKDGRVPEHVMVMAEVLGRPIKKGEKIHHRNGIRTDNRPENLELWAKSHPKGQRISDQVEWAKELLWEYEPEALR